MARKPPRLAVRLSARARLALQEIWNWNAEKYGVQHADAYIELLMAGTVSLETNYPDGRAVPTLEEVRYRVIKKRAGTHGHLVVYRVSDNVVHVINYYHTAQNWQDDLADQEP